MQHPLPRAHRTQATQDLRAQSSYERHLPYPWAYQRVHHARYPISSQPKPCLNPTSTNLAIQYKSRQLPSINPMQPSDHGKTARDPPTITNILQLLRPTIQPSSLHLPLTQPHSQLILLHSIQSPRNSQSRTARKDLPRMRFCSRGDTISTIEIRTRDNVVNRLLHIHELQQFQQRKPNECTAYKSCIFFSPFIARESPCFSVLQSCDVCFKSAFLPLPNGNSTNISPQP
jgi:hypothetical protein